MEKVDTENVFSSSHNAKIWGHLMKMKSSGFRTEKNLLLYFKL